MNLSLTENKEAIQEILDKIGNDGHSLVKPSLFNKVPAEWLAEVTQLYESDGTPKGTIFSEGTILDKVEGIYTLDCLARVARDLNLMVPGMMGRGFQARAYTKAITEAVRCS